MPTNVDIPSLGESVSEAVLLRWLKEDGESVAAAEPIAELETDKANVDLPAPTAGVLRRAKEAGETVHIGETIARIDDAGAGAAKPAAPASKPAPSAAPASSPSSAPSKPKLEDLSPAVRRVVEENKIDPTAVRATGPGGRITKEDVQRHLDERGNGHNAKADESDEADDESDAPPAPEPATKSAPPAKAIAESRTIATHPKPPAEKLTFDATGTKRVAMSKMRKRIADRLVSAQQTAAILTTFNEVDLHQVMEIRSRHKERFEKQYGVGLGFMSFFARAVVLALREFPRVNASIDGGDIVYNQHVHLGIAVSTDRGLAVPVLRNTDQMGFAQIESEIKRLAAATREGKLGLDELTGGTFTITNGGIFGSLLSTPIINPPQSAILGMHAIQKRPVVTGDDKIEVRPMMYVALSYDHRLIDGRESVTFLVRIKELLEDPTRLMLEI